MLQKSSKLCQLFLGFLLAPNLEFPSLRMVLFYFARVYSLSYTSLKSPYLLLVVPKGLWVICYKGHSILLYTWQCHFKQLSYHELHTSADLQIHLSCPKYILSGWRRRQFYNPRSKYSEALSKIVMTPRRVRIPHGKRTFDALPHSHSHF